MPAQTKILLVDDNVDLARALAEILRYRGYSIEVATTARDAMARIGTARPHVLVVDIQMPEMNGAELIRRAREQYPDLASIIISGFPPEHRLVREAVRATGGAYVGKPVDVSRLLQVIASTAVQRPSR